MNYLRLGVVGVSDVTRPVVGQLGLFAPGGQNGQQEN